MGRGLHERSHNHFNHSLSLPQHIIVPEPQYPKSLSAQPVVTPLITHNIFHVLSAIHFHNHSRLETGKVNDVAAKRYLAAEPVTVYLPAPQSLPEMLFSIGHVLAKHSGFVPEHHSTPFRLL